MRNHEQTLLAALHADPSDETAWLALADALEEGGQDERAELLRLHRALRRLGEGPRSKRMQERIGQLLRAGVRPCVPTLTSSIGMELALIPAGTFLMGSPDGEKGRNDREGPLHEVEITRAFYLGIYPVTQAQWRAVMGDNPSWFCAGGGGEDSVKGLNTDAFPVEHASWQDVQAFLERLSALPEEKTNERRYRLPTEAEWEYSCRGGARSYQVFCFGNTLSSREANFNGNFPCGASAEAEPVYLARTSEVGSYAPNAFGLYDMHGNVWEWCADWFDEDYYRNSPRRDPAGPSRGSLRVIRGGGWYTHGQSCRSAYRFGRAPAQRNDDLGFRVALVPSSE